MSTLKKYALSGAAVIVALVALAASGGTGAAQSSPTPTGSPDALTNQLLTPSPTPFLPEATAEPATACVSGPGQDDAASAEGAIYGLVGYWNIEPLQNYFNAGGTVETLRTVFDTAGSDIGPFRSQVVEADVTGDGIPEIFVAVTNAMIDPTLGESQLIMLRCVDGAYQNQILFLQGGAGSRGEGLYMGGGAHILNIADLNGNGAMDLVTEVDWRHDYGDYAEYYVTEWVDDDFQSIVSFDDPDLLMQFSYIRSDAIGDFAVVDLDGDGVYELMVDGVTYRWDGTLYAAGMSE